MYAEMYNTKKQQLMDDMSTPFWLKGAIRELENKDCLDADSMAAALAELMHLRADAILNGEYGQLR